MPIRMTKPSEGSNYSVAIEDRFDVSEDHIVELMSMDEYNGVSTIDGKPYTSLMWHCRIYDAEGVAFLNEIDHSPYDFVEFSSMSLAKGTKTAKAREWAGAFLGHELNEAECEQIAENFDGALVGQRALASWKLEDDKKNGGKKMRFALLRPVPARLRKAAAPAERPLASRSAAPEPVTTPNGSAKLQAVPAASETSAERRARLQAELSAMDAEDEAAADDEVPF